MTRSFQSWAALAVGLTSFAALAEAWDITPPPRGEWVLDQTGKVSSSTISQLNELAASLDASGAGQLGVLLIDSTNGIKPRDFATGVFNSWGVGHSGADDGILLFFAIGDRKSEIILGDGSKVKSSQTDVVMRDDVVANMKRGNLDQALLSAARSLDGLMRRAVGKAAPHPGDNTGLGGHTYVTPRVETGPDLDEKLAPYAEGHTSFAERSPRSWVIDLSELLTPSQRAQLDVAASDIYSADQGRIFFLVTNSAFSHPATRTLAERLLGQVGVLSKKPTAIIAVNLGRADAAIVLPPSAVRSSWDRQQVDAARAELLRAVQLDRVAAMLAAQRFAQTAMTTGIPPRPMGDVLHEGLQRNKAAFTWGGGGFLVVGLLGLRRWNRKRVRVCKDCKTPRTLLDESADDEHLHDGQQTEESIGSVDYDVWWCERCDDVLVLRYSAWFSGYSNCPQCNNSTKSSNSTTLRSATRYSEGLKRIDEKCAHCSYRNSYTRTIPRLPEPSTSSSSSSGSSSFGGGRSSGGGSSGSW